VESSRAYYLIAIGVIAIIALAFSQHNPFSSDDKQRELAAERGEEQIREAHVAPLQMRQQISLSGYTALRKGMTYDEVVQLQGAGKEVGRKVEYYRELVTYRWEDQAHSAMGGPAWMELTFADGKLSEMKQEGLQ
jgi:hypothetical protein